MAVFLAGACGALCRYVVDGVVQERWSQAFPIGTFVVNMSGAFLLGIGAGFFAAHISAPNDVKAIVETGFIGAYTTFSTWMYETSRLFKEGARRYGLMNILGSVMGGSAVAAIGLLLGGRL
jgi:CrcB protein